MRLLLPAGLCESQLNPRQKEDRGKDRKVIKAKGDTITVNAKNVILATGGYNFNVDMVKKLTGIDMIPVGAPGRTGDGIKMAMKAGADLWHMSNVSGFNWAYQSPYLSTCSSASGLAGKGIYAGISGKRFMDENNTYVVKARTTALQTLDNQAWVIVDSECPVLDKVIAKFDRLHSPYGKADTIEELCKQVNLPEKNVVKEVKAYNDALAAGKLEEMVPPCTYKKPHPVAKAPFYAVPFQGGMTATFGGPLINTKAEIQSLDGGSIPGLYAAGNAAGGIFFFNYAGGAQLGAATVYGRIAGRELANRAKQN